MNPFGLKKGVTVKKLKNFFFFFFGTGKCVFFFFFWDRQVFFAILLMNEISFSSLIGAVVASQSALAYTALTLHLHWNYTARALVHTNVALVVV